MEGIRGHLRLGLDGLFQLVVISMEDDIGFPLLVHIIRVPQGTKLHGQRFEGLNVGEGRTFWHFPCNECDQYEKPAKVELIPLVLCFPAIKL
jgi:hypothetical protein